jgi:acetyl-CoA synthetase
VSEHQDWFPIPETAARNTQCSAADYDCMYAQSISAPDAFWAEQAKRIDWFTPPTKVGNWSFDPVSIKWYEDGVLNLCRLYLSLMIRPKMRAGFPIRSC